MHISEQNFQKKFYLISTNMNELFPVFLKTNQLNFLVVGGGNVAHEKLHFLFKSSPKTKIDLVAEKILPEVFELLKKFPDAKVYQRKFKDDDVFDKHLVIAATNNMSLNMHLRTLANKHQFLLNVADKSELCDFYLGGIVTKGNLKIGISTNGKSPILAKRLRETFEEILPPSIEATIESMYHLRKKLHGNFDAKLKVLNELTTELKV